MIPPRVRLRSERAGFLVKTVDRPEELDAALRLRHDIFHREQNGRTLASGVDIDDIDEVCDHLIIRDAATGHVAGTYRLTSTSFARNFYASKRFELGRFLAMPGEKVELGRACVSMGYRNGAVLQLLWRGITEYAAALGARYLFGSASIRDVAPRTARALSEALRTGGYFSEAYGVATRPEHRAWRDEDLPGTPMASDTARRMLPPLFQSYLRAGARIAAEPARDTYLNSFDFLTILDMQTMASRFVRRFRAG
jgi:putative hemolysin